MSNSLKPVLLQSFNVVAFAVTITINALASSLTLNGITTAEVFRFAFYFGDSCGIRLLNLRRNLHAAVVVRGFSSTA